jgi:SET domain-containing protein
MDSIDATQSASLGRFVNDTPRAFANCNVKVQVINDTPHIVIYACGDIHSGDELRYDYGVRDLPWRRVRKVAKLSA